MILLVNVYGFVNWLWEVLDGKDINCFFLGSSWGFLAFCLVNVLVKKVLFGVDIIFDYYIGGVNLYNYL